jgi:hypothetical protein
MPAHHFADHRCRIYTSTGRLGGIKSLRLGIEFEEKGHGNASVLIIP